MRCFLYACCVALVLGLVPAFADDANQAETPVVIPEAMPSASATELPPSRVGRVSFASGGVDLRGSAEGAWADAGVNQPIFGGVAIRTTAQARAEIEIGANRIDLADSSDIEIAGLKNDFTEIALSRGRVGIRLRQIEDGETVEIDFPGGGLWLLGPGQYDIDAGSADQPPRVMVFAGAAKFADMHIEAGQTAVLPQSGSESVTTASEPIAADGFVEWCRARDYDETRLAAPYFLSTDMTGFAELDTAGLWKIEANYGPVWFPTDPDWSPYRLGHWSWIVPWAWTWIDDQPWGFVTSHYGRWAMIDDHWAWVPGGFDAHPLFVPAVVAFLGTPGIGLSSEDGATVAWFPLAPGEVYWPAYTRDVSYVRSLNTGDVRDVETIRMPPDGEPPLESYHEDFANRRFATVVPRSVFVNGRPVASARVTLPEHRLQNAPVLMASPQIAPPSPQQAAVRIATQVVKIKANRLGSAMLRKPGARVIRTAVAKPRGREPIIIRAAHLHVPSYAGRAHGRQVIVLRAAHSVHAAAGKAVRF